MRKSVIRALSAVILTVLFSVAVSWAAEPAEPRVPVDISGHPFKGPADAPVVVVVFSDYL
jgi:protein-disulfide isomerase